jgi:hypothetical protein
VVGIKHVRGEGRKLIFPPAPEGLNKVEQKLHFETRWAAKVAELEKESK